ncbi:putative membrane protein insertion efficiency factor isoform X2 [Vigna unguiculata]|uniref:putative membrane protein insertion efficiency factor isoform X2 n=1 Tax=Vigna unguiculata TaxID=3917 RepID=UPI001015CACC|nr:putative membrane protein insertion efficiency factor isoform X2 [Vigna unguiculata]
MANLFLSPNSYSPTLIQNRNLSSIKIKINRRHYPFRTLQHHYIRLVCALKEDSNPETVQGEISPILPKSCRYVPTCSEYSMEAYKRYGVVKGTVLTAWRLCRCNPLGGHGYDPPRWFGEPRLPEDVDD